MSRRNCARTDHLLLCLRLSLHLLAKGRGPAPLLAQAWQATRFSPPGKLYTVFLCFPSCCAHPCHSAGTG